MIRQASDLTAEMERQRQILLREMPERLALTALAFALATIFADPEIVLVLWAVNLLTELAANAALARAGRSRRFYVLALALTVVIETAYVLAAGLAWYDPDSHAKAFAVGMAVVTLMHLATVRSMTHVWLAAPFMALGMAMLLTLGRGLDALTLGEDAAQTMGVNLTLLRWMLIGGTAAAVGAGVAVAGAVGFVGLVVPHILRPLVGARPSRLLPASALGGAAMLLAADIATRLIAPDRDLKLGVLTAIVGAPFFLHLIWRMRRVEA